MRHPVFTITVVTALLTGCTGSDDESSANQAEKEFEFVDLMGRWKSDCVMQEGIIESFWGSIAEADFKEVLEITEDTLYISYEIFDDYGENCGELSPFKLAETWELPYDYRIVNISETEEHNSIRHLQLDVIDVDRGKERSILPRKEGDSLYRNAALIPRDNLDFFENIPNQKFSLRYSSF